MNGTASERHPERCPLHPPCDRHACKQSEKACPALSLLCFQAHSAFVVSYLS